MKAKAVLQKMLTVGARQEEVTEALVELQDLESYIEEQIRDSQPTARFRNSETVQAECRGAREAYTDILQKIKGGEC